MDRKKTILTAVLINAGLLAVLLVAALTRQEEIALPSEQVESLPLPSEPKEAVPLFVEPVDLAAKESPPETPPSLVQPVPAEEPISHKLPPLEMAPKTPTSIERTFTEIAVKKGDTLDKIARVHQTTADEIIKLNQLPSSFLRVGQILKVPLAKTLAAAPKLKPSSPLEKTAGPEYYTVKVGDNPWTIAMKHHLKVEELLRLNGLNEEKARKLKPGDRLRIR